VFGTWNIQGIGQRTSLLLPAAEFASADLVWVCEAIYTKGAPWPRNDPLLFRTVAPRDLVTREARPGETPLEGSITVLGPRRGRSEGGGGWIVGPRLDPTRLRELPGGIPGFVSFLVLDEKVLIAGLYLQPTAPLETTARCIQLPEGSWEATIVMGDLNADLSTIRPATSHDACRHRLIIESLVVQRGLQVIQPVEGSVASYLGGNCDRWLDWLLTYLPEHSRGPPHATTCPWLVTT
jgi:hypothetical protein